MNKYIPLMILLLLLIGSASAVIMDPTVTYICGDWEVKSTSVCDVPYINFSDTFFDTGWVNGNITFAGNLTSNRTLVEVGKGYTDGGSHYFSNLTIDAFAPADWTVYLNLNFNYLYMQNLTGDGWTGDLLFDKYLFDSDTTLINDNSVETFLQRTGVWPNVDFVFRHNGGWDSWWIDDPVNDVETIDNIIDHPEYDEYSFHLLGVDRTMRLIKPHTDANLTAGAYFIQTNATHRRYTYPFNPSSTLDLDTTNFTNMTVSATIQAFNDTLQYSGSWTVWNITSIHEVGQPYGSDIIYGDYNTTLHSLNITWNPGNNSDTTVVVRNNATWPTTPIDGYGVQNNSDIWYNESDVNSTRYFSLFGYNATTNSYSPPTQVHWGVLGCNVFNESNPAQAIDFDIEITNADASETYVALDQTNTLWIDLLDIPYGEDTIITLSNSSYKTRALYYDLNVCQFYNYSWYLPPITTPTGGGGGANITRLYRVRVVDDDTYPVDQAKVTIQKYINTTDSYETMAILITNGYGEADVWLIPEDHYKVFIEKDGYYQETPTPDWFPDPLFYGANYPRIFQIYLETPVIIDYQFWDWTTFEGTMNANNTIYITYNDGLANTTNAQFYTSELFNFTTTLVSTNTTTLDSYAFLVTGINTSRPYEVILHLNHTNFGYVIIKITINPIRDPIYDRDSISNIIMDIVGSFDLPWIELLFIYIPGMVLLVIFHKSHAEIGIIGAGLWIGFISALVLLHPVTVGSGVFLIFFGGIYGFVKGGKHKV